MIGTIALYLSLFSAVAASIFFGREATKKGEKPKSFALQARFIYYGHAIFTLLASLYLLYALLSHKFHYVYVYAHTDLNLPTAYLFSAFWAGQEGSFLFWTFCGAVVGLLILRREIKLLPHVMAVVSTGQAFIFLFLVLENPFIAFDFTPADGTGLNPLLMDPWMVIHPPLTFIAYALLIVPFAYAVAALWEKDYHEGFLRTVPWALIGWFFLSTGAIIIGGAWAYRVLGWGGYWGWDPVENASLIPWLIGAALIHGLLIQKQKHYLLRANIFLAITTYLFVVFATFLTRSGVMADYSVHAFAETRLTFFLVLFMLILALAGYGLFILRFKDMSPENAQPVTLMSRPFIFSFTIVLLCLSAAVVLMGTLSPIITGWFGTPATADQSFYIRTNTPILLLLFVALAVCPYLSWRRQGGMEFFREIRLFLFASLAIAAATFFLGVQDVLIILLVWVLALAFLTNTASLVKVLRKGLQYCGGYLAHVGIALMFAGVVASTAYTDSQLLFLSSGQPDQAHGYQFTFTGFSIEDEKNVLHIDVMGENNYFVARPKMYMAGERLMREPHISRNLWRDLYISPLELNLDDTGELFILRVGESVDIHGYTVKFDGLTVQDNHGMEEYVEVGAVLEIGLQGETMNAVPGVRVYQDKREYASVLLPGGAELYLVNVDAGTSRAQFELLIDCCGHRNDLLVVDVKYKPLISVLSLGAVLLVAGSGLATWRRFKVSRVEGNRSRRHDPQC